ncbi:MAG TPA: hypothetical protein VH763_02890 [Gemmatimonadales bacterium]|jgi:hypothetical protein
MGQLVWQEQVAALSGNLNALETQVAAGEVSAPGLEEFKNALDDLRLRAWSLLTAVNSGDPRGFQQRFRTRRGIEMCRALRADLQTGKLSGSSDLPDLADAARDLATAAKQVAPKASKRRGRKAP